MRNYYREIIVIIALLIAFCICVALTSCHSWRREYRLRDAVRADMGLPMNKLHVAATDTTGQQNDTTKF